MNLKSWKVIWKPLTGWFFGNKKNDTGMAIMEFGRKLIHSKLIHWCVDRKVDLSPKHFCQNCSQNTTFYENQPL